MTKKVETKAFDAKIDKLLDLVINSLYTNKDIFIRELLSNASDALDKIKFMSLSDDKILKDDDILKISIRINEATSTLTFEDNGIGMNYKELIDNLGKIANSGTKEFLSSLESSKEKPENLIGQFGVGFYSSFMVASKVTVYSKKTGETKLHKWESNGKGDYTIEETNDIELDRGTKIVLTLKEEEKGFLDRFQLKSIIKTYSDHIFFPIEVIHMDDVKKEEEIETVNSSSALWAREKSEIKENEYEVFFKTLAMTQEPQWLTLHNKIEGAVNFTSLLFIPSAKPFDLFNPERKATIKLYSKRIFITDSNVDIIPSYLRFIKGVVDSSDIALNVSRETLQNNAVISKLNSSITKKILNELKKQSNKHPENFIKFWDNFGAVLKEGLCEYTEFKESILEICQFKTSKSLSSYTSLEKYIDNMPATQEHIYYLVGEDINAMISSPQLELFKEKNIEVLFLIDQVDHFWVNVVTEFGGKSLQSVTKSDNSELSDKKDGKKDGENDSSDKKEEKIDESIENFIKFSEEILKDNIKKVRVSKKLTKSISCLAVDEGMMDIRMERMLMEQKQIQKISKKILEINFENPVIKKLTKDINTDLEKNKEHTIKTLHTIYDIACVAEGEPISNPSLFVNRVSEMLEQVS